MCTCGTCNNYNGRIVTAKPANVALNNLEFRSDPASDVTIIPTTEGEKFVWTIGGGLKLLDALGTSKTKAISQDAVNTAVNSLTTLANTKANSTDVTAGLASKFPKTTLLPPTTALNTVLGEGPYIVFTSAIAGLNFPETGEDKFTGTLLVIGNVNLSAAITQILTRASAPCKQWIRSLNHSGVDGTSSYWEDWVETTGPVLFSPLTIGTTTTWETAAGTVNNKTLLLTQNTAIALSDLVNGSRLILVLTQDATGGHNVTLPAGSLPVSITINTTPNGVTKLVGDYDGTHILWEAHLY